MSQRELFDGLDERPGGRRTIQERFEEFHAAHPDVYALFKRFAFELREAGRERYGSDAIMQQIRWHYATSSSGGPDFKINDAYTSRYVRKLIADHPEEFRDFFELRQLRSE